VDLQQGPADAQVAGQPADVVPFFRQRGHDPHPVRIGERRQHPQQGVSGHVLDP
jgi:hypothetical protein